METWTHSDIQKEIFKKSKIINGQPFINIEDMKAIVFDPRYPSDMSKDINELMYNIFKKADELKKNY